MHYTKKESKVRMLFLSLLFLLWSMAFISTSTQSFDSSVYGDSDDDDDNDHPPPHPPHDHDDDDDDDNDWISYPCTCQEPGCCTYSKGRWKTNCDSPLCDTVIVCEKTLYEILKTKNSRNMWYTLAHQYTAAYLNVHHNNACMHVQVQESFNVSLELLENNCDENIKSNCQIGVEMKHHKDVLDFYNNGYHGPGHCNDDDDDDDDDCDCNDCPPKIVYVNQTVYVDNTIYVNQTIVETIIEYIIQNVTQIEYVPVYINVTEIEYVKIYINNTIFVNQTIIETITEYVTKYVYFYFNTTVNVTQMIPIYINVTKYIPEYINITIIEYITVYINLTDIINITQVITEIEYVNVTAICDKNCTFNTSTCPVLCPFNTTTCDEKCPCNTTCDEKCSFNTTTCDEKCSFNTTTCDEKCPFNSTNNVTFVEYITEYINVTVTEFITKYINTTNNVTLIEYITEYINVTVTEYITEYINVTVTEFITKYINTTNNVTLIEYITEYINVTVTEFITKYINTTNNVTLIEYITEYINVTVTEYITEYINVTCPEPPTPKCFGLNANHPGACSGHGICYRENTCDCHDDYMEEDCSILRWEECCPPGQMKDQQGNCIYKKCNGRYYNEMGVCGIKCGDYAETFGSCESDGCHCFCGFFKDKYGDCTKFSKSYWKHHCDC